MDILERSSVQADWLVVCSMQEHVRMDSEKEVDPQICKGGRAEFCCYC